MIKMKEEEFDIIKFLFYIKGRASKKEFWFYILSEFITLFVVGIIIEFFKMTKEEATSFMGLVSLIFVYPNIAVTAKRAHDFNYSAYLSLVTLLPYLGSILMLIIGFVNGDEEENKYGFPKKKL